MNCKKCGSNLEPNEKFCSNCGEKVEELNNQVVGTPVSATPAPQPILPDAPEAPLPGTANKVTEAPVTPQAPVAPTQTDVQPAAPATPVAPQTPVNQAQSAPTPVAPTPTSVVSQAPVAPQVQSTQPTENKKLNVLIIVIIVVLAIAACALLFVLLYGTNGLKNKDKTTTTTTEATTTTTTTTKMTTTTTTTSRLVYEQVINGVAVTIPDGWTYIKSSNVGIIRNASRGTQINIYPINKNNFEYYKQNLSLVETTLTQSGVQIVSRDLGNDGQREYIMFNIIYNGRKEIMLFTNMPNGNVIRFEILQMDIQADEVLKVTNSIASSARELQTGQNFSAGIDDYLS